MIIAAIKIIVGFIVLMWAADRFVLGAVTIARKLGVSSMLIGLTIVALGTSAPEIFVAIVAAMDGHTGLAIGNAIGSNIANISLVLGITALIIPLQIKSDTLRREYPIMLMTLVLTGLLLIDGTLSHLDGFILLIGLVVVMLYLIRLSLRKYDDEPLEQEYDQELSTHTSTTMAIIWLLLGFILMPISSDYLVQGAITVAKFFGVSDLVIGLTIIAIGTSLPEIAASIMSALKKEADIAVGNIIGSNIFNMLAVLAIPALIHPAALPSSLLLSRDFTTMLFVSILFFIFAFSKRGKGIIRRWEGGVLVICYITYIVILLYTSHI